ncbi:DnaJ subfamily C member 7 [Balamuthia mandrillaris]
MDGHEREAMQEEEVVQQQQAPKELTTEEKEKEALRFKQLGNTEYLAGNYRKAVAFYSKAIEFSPDTAAYYGNRAAAYIMEGDWRAALDDSLVTTAKDPSFTKGYLRAGKCYLRLGDFTRSKLQYEKALHLEPNNVEAKKDLKLATTIKQKISEGKKALKEKQFGAALHIFEGVLDECEESNPILMMKANALLGLQQYSIATKLASQVLKQDPHNVEALFIKGKAFYFSGNFAQALNFYTQALKLDPDFAKARVELKMVRTLERKKKEGNDAFGAGRYQEAFDAYSEALQVDPDNKTTNAQLYCNRAAAGTKLGQYEEAIRDCTRALDLDNTYTKAFLRRATLYTLTEKYEEAVRDYESAKKLDPENRGSFFVLIPSIFSFVVLC